MPDTTRIRPATVRDIPALANVERRAAERFRAVGLDAIAESGVNDPDFIESCRRFGALIVAVDRDDKPVGFVMAGRLDGAMHIYELSVVPEHGGQGVGRRLMGAIEGAARARGLSELTLSTFIDVPWNAPFYERLGYRPLRRGLWTPAFHMLRGIEEAVGLPVERRVFLRKRIG